MFIYIPKSETKWLEDGMTYRTYGIVELKTKEKVSDASTRLTKVLAIALKLTIYKASPIHLKEIIEDMI